jgi:hypothetical protein
MAETWRRSWWWALLLASGVTAGALANVDESFLSWDKDRATSTVAAMRRMDNVGSRMAFRGLKTDRAINYRMRATWLTPEVIRAAARLIQLNERLSPERTRALVSEADAVGDTVFLIEIDPNEGSGIVPDDWIAILQPKGLPRGDAGAVQGVRQAPLRDVRALSGVFKRDYAYDAYWVVFSLRREDGKPLFGEVTQDAELVINIHGREAVVSWPVPASIRERAARQ